MVDTGSDAAIVKLTMDEGPPANASVSSVGGTVSSQMRQDTNMHHSRKDVAPLGNRVRRVTESSHTSQRSPIKAEFHTSSHVAATAWAA